MRVKTLERAITQVANAIIRYDVKRATKYLLPNYTVKATVQGNPDGRCRQRTILVTYGRPNYLEEKFIKLAKKAGEPFPIKKVQMKNFTGKKVSGGV